MGTLTRAGVMLAVGCAVALPASSASAHVTKAAGPFEVSVGWSAEPPSAGSDNAVEVEVSEAGAPVSVPQGALSVVVSFEDAAVTLPLEQGEEPGLLTAALVPTRPGTYGFDVSGELDGHQIEVDVTCSENTFECVQPRSELEFPVADPTAGEIAERLARELPRIDDASGTASDARTIAIAALLVALLALGVAIAVALRARRRG